MAAGELVAVKDYAMMRQEPAGLLELLHENVGVGGLSEFDLERVKVPTGGGTNWEVPNLEGTPTMETTLDGIVVYHRDPRAYWQIPFDQSGGGSPPDCSSAYGDVGIGTPGGECAPCPMAQFGSKPMPGDKESRGQACKAMKLIFLLRPDALLPTAIFLPPTSIRPFRSYLLGLVNKSLPYWGAATSLALTKSRNNDGIEYAQVQPRLAGTLDAKDAARIKEYADALRGSLDTITIHEEDAADESASS